VIFSSQYSALLHWKVSPFLLSRDAIAAGMGQLNIAARKRVIILWRSGYTLSDIKRRLDDEEVEVALRSLQYLLLKFLKYRTVKDLPRARRSRLLTPDMMNAIEDSLKADDELTAIEAGKVIP